MVKAKRTTAAVEKVIHTLAGVDAVNDRELLHRFVSENDQAAFEAIVRRHTGLVLGVCRRALSHPQDAEDASQATFVILAKKAKSQKWQASIANWLYATARGVAQNARVAAMRRRKREGRAAVSEIVLPVDTMTGRELLTMLDEELDKLPPRYREPLVLCYLEGLTRDEAATRLDIPAGTMKSRLERGRKRLADALTSRGCLLGGGLLALAATSSARASSPQLIANILASASGSPSAAVTALTQGVAMNGIARKLIFTAFAIAAFAGLGFGWWSVKPATSHPRPNPDHAVNDSKPNANEEKKIDEMKTVAGRVLGPDGKAVPNAVIALIVRGADASTGMVEFARSNTDGQFTGQIAVNPGVGRDLRTLVARVPGFAADWSEIGSVRDGSFTFRLTQDDVRIKGRVVGLEGKPIAKAKVTVKSIEATPEGSLKPVFDHLQQFGAVALNYASKKLYQPAAAGIAESVTTDADGRFEITGVGQNRLVALQFEAAGIESANVRVVSQTGFDAKTLLKPSHRGMMPRAEQPMPDFYGPEFTHTAKPDQPITGVVTDSKTGKPLAGVFVTGSVRNGWWENNVRVSTDSAGRYTIRGVGKGTERQLTFYVSDTSPYVMSMKLVRDVPGLEPIVADNALTRGVIVTGQITDKVTGQPVRGASVRYIPLAGNETAKNLLAANAQPIPDVEGVRPDGRYRLTVLPGPGVILAQTQPAEDGQPTYAQVWLEPADRKYGYLNQLDSLGEAFSAFDGHIEPLFNQLGYKVVDPADGAEAINGDIQFDPGKTITGRVVGPDGQPLEGVMAYGLHATYSRPTEIKNGKFTVAALDPAHPRAIVFVHKEKKLTGSIELSGNETDPLVKLEPWGVVTGKVVDADGKPLADVSVTVAIQNQLIFSGYQRMRDTEAPTKTDKDGNFRIDVRFPGKAFSIFMSRNGRPLTQQPPVKDVVIAAGATKVIEPIVVPVE